MFAALRFVELEFDYVNCKGEKSHRRIRNATIEFKSNEWHIEPQWLMNAFDYDKQVYREFAMKDMTNVKEIG